MMDPRLEQRDRITQALMNVQNPPPQQQIPQMPQAPMGGGMPQQGAPSPAPMPQGMGGMGMGGMGGMPGQMPMMGGGAPPPPAMPGAGGAPPMPSPAPQQPQQSPYGM